MYQCVIATEEPTKKGEKSKGRSFTFSVLGAVQADPWWASGSGGVNLRPAFLAIGASEGEIRAVVANLRMGKEAQFVGASPTRRDATLEFLKSHKHSLAFQRLRSGVVATFTAPDIFNVNPGMVEPSGIKFITMVTPKDLEVPWDKDAAFATVCKYADQESAKAPYRYDADVFWFKRFIPYAPYVIQQLDARSRAPLLADPSFYALLLYFMVREGMAGVSSADSWESRRVKGIMGSLYAYNMESLGFAPPMGVRCSHEDFEALLAKAATWFMNQ